MAMGNELRFAVRSLMKAPGFTAVALLTLALGIGVNTSMFSLANVLLFRAASYPQGDRIIQILGETREGRIYNHSETEAREVRDGAKSFSSLTSLRLTSSAFAGSGKPAEQVFSAMASSEMFETFQTQPFLGRAFTAGECEQGKNQVIVLSHAFWLNRFGGDRGVVGRTVRIDGEPVTIIGVMPASFDWRVFWGSTAFWRPLNFTTEQLTSRANRAFMLVGRLKDGATIRQAAAELGRVAANQQKDFPNDYAGFSYNPRQLNRAQVEDEDFLLISMLLGLSGFVLLIACANLANLQLARATTAMREFAIRTALGARRADLIRRQLVECVLVSATGGGLGIVLALWLNTTLSSMINIAGETNALDLPVDARVLLVTFAVALATGIVFGIVPAWLSSRTDVVNGLKSQSRGSTAGRGSHRMRALLIVGEVTLALMLLGGAAVMQRGFGRLIHKDAGWDKDMLLAGGMPLPESRFPEAADKVALFRRIESRLETLPGVEAAALTTAVPFWSYGSERPVMNEGQADVDRANLPKANYVRITPDFFKVLGAPMLEGRSFTDDIKPDGPKVVIVNEALAKKFWPGESAVGRRLASFDGDTSTWFEVIGVVADVDLAVGVSNLRTPFQFYRPVVQDPGSSIRFAVRSRNPAALTDTVRIALAEIDPDLPATDVMTVAQASNRQQANLLVVAKILDGFAVLGLVLAAVGLYGVVSNLVAQRTSEFGIRLALGATPGDVLGLVLRHGVKLTLVGLVLGLGGAYGVALLLGAIMPRMVSADPLALGTMAALLFIVALVSCWIPARRATRVDPMIALRAE